MHVGGVGGGERALQPRRYHCPLCSHLSPRSDTCKVGGFTVGRTGVSFEKLPVEGEAEKAGKAE